MADLPTSDLEGTDMDYPGPSGSLQDSIHSVIHFESEDRGLDRSLQQQMDVILGLCTAHLTEQAALKRCVTTMDEKLSRLLERPLPGKKAVSMAGHAASMVFSLPSPVQSRGISAFKKDVDQLLDAHSMKAPRPPWSRQNSREAVSRSASKERPRPVPAKQAQVQPEPGIPASPVAEEPFSPKAMSSKSCKSRGLHNDSKPSKTSKSSGDRDRALDIGVSTGMTNSDVSLSNLFRHREAQLMPTTPPHGAAPPPLGTTPPSKDGGEECLAFPDDPEEAAEAEQPNFLLRAWLSFLHILCRLTGLTPVVQTKARTDENSHSRLSTKACVISKLYHCGVLFLAFLCLVGSGWELVVCRNAGALPFCSSALATDSMILLGALAAVWSCGGFYSYWKTANSQMQISEHLMEYIEGAGLSDYWAKQKALDATLMAGVWLLVVGLRIWSWQSDAAEDTLGALEVLAPVAYAFTTAMLLCACYLQNSKWRGISLAIAAFARSVLEGEISCMTARMKWRELIGAMRQTSRMYQLTAASLASTTVLVAFAMLYDIFKGHGANAVPNVVLALVMPSSLYVAACATADCTRLPSLLCMLDGDEDEEREYMDLALFLTLSESGFFMWDTRVTLGVLQKFVYFTAAVVGTISFQLKLIAV